jgi:phosphoketolase
MSSTGHVSVIFRYELHFSPRKGELPDIATYDFPPDGNCLLHLSDRGLQPRKLIDIVMCPKRLQLQLLTMHES